MPSESTVTTGSQEAASQKVLIIGDWFVDEHWVVGVHRSSSSSRTGMGHYRALHEIGTQVQAFCGAGRSASFLHHATLDGKTRFFSDVIGLGFWHPLDTDALRCLFDPTAVPYSPFRLVNRFASQNPPSSVRLINMHDAYFVDRPERRDEVAFTDRIIRIYRQGKGDEIRYERFDWERKPSVLDWHWERADGVRPQLSELQKAVAKELGGSPPAVVLVKDLLKGAVTEQVIEWMVEWFREQKWDATRWYVSSKRWKPQWIKELRKVDLRLFLIPQVAAREALTQEDKLSCWLTRSGRPSGEALELMKELDETIGATDRGGCIAVLPGEYEVLCRAPGGKNPAQPDTVADPKARQCIVQSRGAPEPVVVPMGGASIFFPALCACLEYEDRLKRGTPTAQMISHSLACTDDWGRGEGKRVLDPVRWNPDPRAWKPEPELLDVSTSVGEATRFECEEVTDWAHEADQWGQAYNLAGYGLIKGSAAGRELQLWRGMVEVEGYVACESSKRRALRKLVRGISDFAKDGRTHTACMLVASPGAGKTFLVKKLADSAKLVFVPFNVTQLSTRSDILGWFETVVAKQEEAPDKKLLVFIDEINAEVDRAGAYGAFLAPLEEGTFVKGGQTFHLSPCVWVFASTEFPQRLPGERSQKGSDFVSRLRLGIVNLTADDPVAEPMEREKAHEALLLERIYLGASLLRSEYPDVRKVSEVVVRAFLALPGDVQVRDIKHFVRSFSDIQYGQVTSKNVPVGWPGDSEGRAERGWRNLVEEYRKGKKASEKADIAIVEKGESPR